MFFTEPTEISPTKNVEKYLNAETEMGHVWLEVDVILENGTTKTYVVDPSNNTILNYDEVFQKAKGDRNSFEALWYAQKDRQYILGP